MEEIRFARMVKHNDRVYKILREFLHSTFLQKDGKVNAEKFNAWKEWLGADHVLKTANSFVFCETVQDIEWEDLPHEVEQVIENC